MNREIFIERYKRFDVPENEINEYIETIIEFETFAKNDIKDVTIEDIKNYMKHLIKTKKNTYGNVVHFARYFYYINKQEEYIHMTKYFNSIGVMENIVDRILLYESVETQNKIMKELELPPFGVDSTELPEYTKEFMEKLNKYLPRTTCNKILAGNNHRIPTSSQEKEKEYYRDAKSLKEYLKDRHQRKVEELTHHYENNLVWFEQIITKEAIEYVKSNQEILSGVIEGDKLYITKIPYDINNFLNETDEKMKRYYACHCSFVRENIKNETVDIPKEWCYCSAGFAKFPFETILDQELNIELLKTPVEGDLVCRFAIDLKTINYK